MSDETELIDPDADDIEAAVADLDQEQEATDAVASDVSASDDVGADIDDVLDEDEGQPRGPDGKFLPKAEKAAEDAPAVDPNAPVVPEPAAVDPFAGYNPFAFKVDGTDVALEGIRANDTHVVIPRELWDRELRPNYLGSRQAWQQERGQWQGRERQYQQQMAATEERARAVVDEFNALIADPNKLLQFVENYERELPLLQQKMRADAAERQIRAVQEQQQAIQQQQQYQALEQAGADALEAEVIALLKEPAFASLAATDDERDDLLVELWQTKAKHWIQVTPDNRVGGIDRESLQSELSRRAQFIARREARVREALTTEQRNKAAVASPATSPRTAPIPKATRTTPAARKAPTSRPAQAQAHRITDEMREQWREDFASVFDE